MSGAGQPVANPMRGEAAIHIAGQVHRLRPSFAALVAAEQELGPLLPLAERASNGAITLAEIAGLFWHCLADRDQLTRDAVGDAVVAAGLGAITPAIRQIFGQILGGTT